MIDISINLSKQKLKVLDAGNITCLKKTGTTRNLTLPELHFLNHLGYSSNMQIPWILKEQKVKTMAWIYLLVAGILEVVWAIGMKYSDGWSRLYPSIFTIVSMVIGFYFLSLAVKSLPLGTA